METIESKSMKNPPPKINKCFMAAQFCLRFLAILTTVGAAYTMFTNKQAVVVYGIAVDARYSYSPAFKFFAIANFIAGVCSVISLFVVCVLGKKGSDFFYMFIHDLVMMTLIMAACAAATAIGYVGKYGNSHTGWMAICDNFGKFCDKVVVSVILSYCTFIFYLFLTLMSASKSRHTQV